MEQQTKIGAPHNAQHNHKKWEIFRKVKFWILLGLSLGLAFGAIYGGMIWLRNKHEIHSKQFAVIQKISCHEMQNQVLLSIAFLDNQIANVEAISQNQQQLILKVKDAQLSTQVIPPTCNGRLIRQVSITHDGDDTIFTLDLNQPLKSPAIDIITSMHIVQVRLIGLEPYQPLQKQELIKTTEELREEQYQAILTLIAAHEYDAAIDAFYNFLGDYPKNLPARLGLASLLIMRGQLAKAENIVKSGLKLYPIDGQLIKLHARILLMQHRYLDAKKILRSVIIAHQDDVEYLALAALAEQYLQNYVASALLYRQLTQLEPQTTEWWIGLAIALEKDGKKNAALEAYQKAAKQTIVPERFRSLLNQKIGAQE